MRLGLIAAARITETAVIQPAVTLSEVEIVGIAARSAVRARDAARTWGLERAYRSYQHLLDDDSLDAVYIATPAAAHRELILAAVAAGRHVLREKPLTANAEDAEVVTRAAARAERIVMEAFHWRYHPMIGQIQSDDMRWDLRLGGGALMDLGCYPVQWVRRAVGAEPGVTAAEAVCPHPGVDAELHADLRWPATADRDAIEGSIHCSMTVIDACYRRAGLAPRRSLIA